MQKKWEKIRQTLANGSHVDTTKQLLPRMSIIRILVASGPGFGDQTIALNVAKHLRSLGFTGTIEMIASLKPIKRWLGDTHHPPLLNLLKLYNVKHLFKKDFLQITSDGFKLVFYDYDYFQKSSSHAEADLALYPGHITWFKLNYETAWIGPNFEHSLASLSKSKRAIYLNFFTLRLADLSDLGFISQLKHQEPQIHYDSQVLSYPVYQDAPEAMSLEIKNIGKYNPQLSETLQSIISLHTSGRVNTLAAYSTHHLFDPEFTLINLILGGSEFNAPSKKPLLILLLSPIKNKSWKNLKQMVSHQTYSSERVPSLLRQGLKNVSSNVGFIDTLLNQTLAVQLINPIIIIRLPSLASAIFNPLFLNSTYPPLYEGINAANSLKSMGRFGLPCPKMHWGEVGVKRSAVADYLEIPLALQTAGQKICSSKQTGFFEDWQQQPTPAQQVIDVFNFTHSTKRSPMLAGDDRVAFAIAKVSEEISCEEMMLVDREQYCDLITFPQENKLLLAGRTLCQGLIYGGVEASFARFFQRGLGMKKTTADSLSRVMQLSIQGLLDGDWSHLKSSYNPLEGDWLIFGVIVIELCCISKYRGEFSKAILNSLMLAVVMLPKIWSADSETLLFAAVLSGVFVMAHTTGRRLVNGLYDLADRIFCPLTSKPEASHLPAV